MFVHLYDSEDMKFDENSKRSPKIDPFDRRGGTRITGNLCLTTITFIICNSMYNIIYILASITGIPIYRATFCYQNPDISGGRSIA